MTIDFRCDEYQGMRDPAQILWNAAYYLCATRPGRSQRKSSENDAIDLLQDMVGRLRLNGLRGVCLSNGLANRFQFFALAKGNIKTIPHMFKIKSRTA